MRPSLPENFWMLCIAVAIAGGLFTAAIMYILKNLDEP
jgi:hypothetical protein